MKKTLNLTGQSGKTYDLDALNTESRLDASKKLVVQIHEYSEGENPNPENPSIGQIWLSVKK